MRRTLVMGLIAFAVGTTLVAVSFDSEATVDPNAKVDVTEYAFPIPLHEMSFPPRYIETPEKWCELPDEDYDGDGLKSEEEYPPQYGEMIADGPTLRAEMVDDLVAYIDYQISSSQQWTSTEETLHELELGEERSASYASEIKTHYAETMSAGLNGSGSVGMSTIYDKLESVFGSKNEFKLSFSGSMNVDKSFTTETTRKYNQSATSRMKSMASKLTTLRTSNTIQYGPDAGRVSGYVRLTNTTNQPLTLLISDLSIHVYAYQPETGYKEYVGVLNQAKSDMAQTVTIPRYMSYVIAIPDVQVSTNKLLTWLDSGYVFGAEIAGLPNLSTTDPAVSVADMVTKVNSRTARLGIKNGVDPHVYMNASVYSSTKSCKSIKEFLEDAIFDRVSGRPEIEFKRDSNGVLYVKRVRNDRAALEDVDFDKLSDKDKSEYRKWIVGYLPSLDNPFAGPGKDFDLEKTIVWPGDRVYLYLLRRSDFEVPVDIKPWKPDASADDVGVVPGSDGCPIGYPTVRVNLDGEDDEPLNGDSYGWVGQIGANKRNATVTLCRVEGSLFHPTVWGGKDAGIKPQPGANLEKYGYAVIKLGDHCPAGSSEYLYKEDTEDTNGWTNIEGDASPGLQMWGNAGSGIEWRLCVFKYTMLESQTQMITFPDLGADYGVFAAPAFEGNGASFKKHLRGWVLVDDEEDDNANSADNLGDSESDELMTKCFYKTSGENTMMKLVRVQ